MTESERISLIRRTLGYKQCVFATALGIKQGSYSDIERGKTGISEKNKIILSRQFGISKEYLDGKDVPMFNPDKNIENLLNRIDEMIDDMNKIKSELIKIRNNNHIKIINNN